MVLAPVLSPKVEEYLDRLRKPSSGHQTIIQHTKIYALDKATGSQSQGDVASIALALNLNGLLHQEPGDVLHCSMGTDMKKLEEFNLIREVTVCIASLRDKIEVSKI